MSLWKQALETIVGILFALFMTLIVTPAVWIYGRLTGKP